MEESEASWLYDYIDTIALYIQTHYGDIRSDRLYAIFHKGKYRGGHPGYYYSPMHDYRNVIDCGYDDWTRREGWVLDAPLHEVAHIVESTVHGKRNSPAFSLWGDSKWSEFFEYSFHNETGNYTYAHKKHREFMAKIDNYPRPNTHWFRDWFYLLYRDYNGSSAMRDFFTLVGHYWNFTRKEMNWGEYLHFMNAVAKRNLRNLVVNAFGWQSLWETQLHKAVSTFHIDPISLTHSAI
jgi:hypothetical protein